MEDHQDCEIAFDLLDADEDGIISKTEFNCAPHFVFSVLDVDSGGRFTRVVFIAGFAIFNTDRDGLITQEEIDAQAPLICPHPKFWNQTTTD